MDSFVLLIAFVACLASSYTFDTYSKGGWKELCGHKWIGVNFCLQPFKPNELDNFSSEKSMNTQEWKNRKYFTMLPKLAVTCHYLGNI